MKLHARYASLCLGCALLLLSCGQKDTGHATPEAAAELAQISVYIPEVGIEEVLEMPAGEEIDELLKQFARTADARLCSQPSGITMLHLACLFKKAELARCLLIDHADPNAVTAMGDTPLGLAVSMRGAEDASVTEDTIIQLIDTLVKAGADLTRHAGNDMSLLNYAGLNGYSEKVFLHLLDLNCPIDETSCQAPAIMGWNTALKRMLDAGAGKVPHALETMLLMAAANLHPETVALLIEAGADVNAHELSGTTALLEAAGHLLSPAEEAEPERRKAIIDICALLIQKGADPQLAEIRQDGSPAFNAADILTKDKSIMAELAARGVHIESQEIKFTQGRELLDQIGKATVLERIPAESDFDAIAAIFTADEGMRNLPQYADVLPMAVELLYCIDAQKTSRILAALPIWTSQEAWTRGHGSSLIPVLSKCPHLILPKQLVCLSAERLNKAGEVDNAATMIELLHRCPDAAAEIEQYCQSASLPLQAGALAAKLRQQNLPTPRDGDVELWLDNHQITTPGPEVTKAALLTSLSRLWYGDMLPEEQEQILKAMEEIGASVAATHYRAIVASMHDPDKLDQLTEDSDTWKFELEIATARYILSQAAAFHKISAQNTD